MGPLRPPWRVGGWVGLAAREVFEYPLGRSLIGEPLGTPVERRVIIVGDGAEPEANFSRLLPAREGFRCESIAWDAAVAQRLRASGAHLVILLAIPDRAPAVELMSRMRSAPPPAPILAVLPESPDEGLLSIASQTADDFICCPVREGELRHRVDRLLAAERWKWQPVCDRLTKEMGLAQLVGRSPRLTEVVEKIPFIAASDVPVLIAGETGTGKELCAHAIHHLSKRRHSPFIPVECGAIPDPLAENELFGHARGAYTGAQHDQKGLAGLAEGGTLFLDEIDALSLTAQAKLLRFLQNGIYRALGAERFIQSDVRVISATNCDLEFSIRQKEFRSDLYFRLNVLQISLPSLRERPEDIRLLAQHFLDSFTSANSATRGCFSPGALSLLERHDWPGNVRELRNVVQRAVVFSSGGEILPCHITISGSAHASTQPAANFRQARQQTIEVFERRYVEQTLRENSGNITRAAVAAGKDRRAFGRLVKKYGLNPRSG